MIPISLSISGFLSYRDTVELDFTTFHLACIAGANGAGKSSLLDAITWALFGQARRRDERIINAHPETDAAQVILDFDYEGNVYRVQRTNPRGKATILEFHIQTTEGIWKPLTERTSRETQARIEQMLRLDYETFVNAAFFLQGKADQFTQQRSGDRKRILGLILGLSIWEVYRQRTAHRRKSVEADITNLDGRLYEINAELAEEAARKARLKELEEELDRLAKTHATQEEALEIMRKEAATLKEQAKLVGALARQLDTSTQRLRELETRMGERTQEQDTYTQTLSRASGIQEAHRRWQEARSKLAEWDEIATRFYQQEKRRHAPLTEIEAERARLGAEQDALLEKQTALINEQSQTGNLNARLKTACEALQQAETQLAQRAALETDLRNAQQGKSDAQAENPRLRTDMEELKSLIDQLEATDGATCPLCGNPLSSEDRQRLIEEHIIQGTEMGNKYRANNTLLEETDTLVAKLQSEFDGLKSAEVEARAHTRTVDQLKTRLDQIQQTETEWNETYAPHLSEIITVFAEEKFAPEARAVRAQIDAELKEIGYDAAAHDEIRRAELEGRATEPEIRTLDKAKAALESLEREVSDLQSQVTTYRAEVEHQQTEHDESAAVLAVAQALAPNLYKAERELLTIQEQENRLLIQVGAARQKVDVLDDLKSRRQALETEREILAQNVTQFKQLERAFSKDGVPALLIEQALPQIEAKANEILERLSGGEMNVRFVTQREYKDKRREDLRETLDIQISDGAGIRDYELFSGGESFRVNFAIRLALSDVLAKRAGARLQTLVIDEGFGSQDIAGRQRLLEAINMVRDDFAKILVITHIDELKDAFPARIEVEKTRIGSVVRVV